MTEDSINVKVGRSMIPILGLERMKFRLAHPRWKFYLNLRMVKSRGSDNRGTRFCDNRGYT